MVAVQATSLKLFLFVSRQRAESVRLWWTHQARVKPYWAETPIKPLYWGRSTGKESDPCRSPLESHEAFQDSNDSKRFKASQDILFVSLYSRLTWSRIPFRSSEPREMPFVTLCSGIASLYSKGTKGVRLVRLLFESFKDRAMKMPRLGEYPVPRSHTESERTWMLSHQSSVVRKEHERTYRCKHGEKKRYLVWQVMIFCDSKRYRWKRYVDLDPASTFWIAHCTSFSFIENGDCQLPKYLGIL